MKSPLRHHTSRPLRRRSSTTNYRDPFFADPVVIEDDYQRMRRTG